MKEPNDPGVVTRDHVPAVAGPIHRVYVPGPGFTFLPHAHDREPHRAVVRVPVKVPDVPFERLPRRRGPVQHLVVGADASKDPAVLGPVKRDDGGGVTGARRRGGEPAVDVGEDAHATVGTRAREQGRVRGELHRGDSATRLVVHASRRV